MKMNKISMILVAAALSVFASCQKDYETYNTNPYEATKEMLEHDDAQYKGLVKQLQRAVFTFRDGTKLDSDYQIQYALAADTWCGYVSSTPFRDGINTGSFYIVDGWTRSMFATKYEYAMNAWSTLNELCVENDRGLIAALGNVLKVANMHQVTDYYGAVPYSEVGISMSPKYDSQESIYRAFFQELGSAIDELTQAYQNGQTTILPDDDLVFGGSVEKWIKFANSLRLRLAVRCAYADAALAQAEVAKSVANPVGLILENNDNAVMPADHHPWYEINVNFNDGDLQLNANVDVYLNGYEDPRSSAYAKSAADGKVHGVRNGIHTSVFTPYRNASGLFSAPNVTKGNLKITWFNAAETYFLLAEAALRGWGVESDAKTYYEKGIAASFEEWKAAGAEAYAANTTLRPAAYVDNNGAKFNAPAPSTVTIAFSNDDPFETSLEKIATQKWIALYPNGAEAWAEQRRTGYPKLIAPVNNDSNGVVDTQAGIRRVPYPVSEYSTNAAGVSSGVSVLGGADNAATKLWWDKK